MASRRKRKLKQRTSKVSSVESNEPKERIGVPDTDLEVGIWESRSRRNGVSFRFMPSRYDEEAEQYRRSYRPEDLFDFPGLVIETALYFSKKDELSEKLCIELEGLASTLEEAMGELAEAA